MSKVDKDESEAAATGEDSSASIKESIEKNMSLLATLTNHLMRNVDSLSDDEHKSVVEEVNDLYLRVKTMILKIQHNLSKKDRCVDFSQEAEKVIQTNREALEKQVKENLKESLSLLIALLVALDVNKDKWCALGNPDPSDKSLEETMRTACTACDSLQQKLKLDQVQKRKSEDTDQLNPLDIFLAGRTIGRAYPEKTTERQPIKEEDSQFTMDTLKETIRKEMFLVVKMVNHVTKLTDGLKEANCESVTENVDQTCHEVMEMVDNIQSNLFDEKREESIDLSESANKIDEINEAAFKEKIKQNLKISLDLMSALLLSLEKSKEKVCALGKPDPSSGSIDKTKSAAMKLSNCLYQAFELEEISTEYSVQLEMIRTKLIPTDDNLERLISEIVNEVIVQFI
jgi:ubiquitin-protein ligase